MKSACTGTSWRDRTWCVCCIKGVLTLKKREERPHFQHTCTRCEFLGGYVYNEEYYDLYWCDQGGSFPTVIARWSDEGPAYLSGIPADETLRVMARYCLCVAYARAKARGLPLKDAIREPGEKL